MDRVVIADVSSDAHVGLAAVTYFEQKLGNCFRPLYIQQTAFCIPLLTAQVHAATTDVQQSVAYLQRAFSIVEVRTISLVSVL